MKLYHSLCTCLSQIRASVSKNFPYLTEVLWDIADHLLKHGYQYKVSRPDILT